MLAPPKPPPLEDPDALIKEARARQLRRRVLGAGALAIAAALGLAVYAFLGRGSPVRTPSGPNNAPAGGSIQRCRSSQLRLAAPTSWGAAAGSLIEDFTLTNGSATRCTVAGWPSVQRVDRRGKTIPVELSRWVYSQRGPAPFRRVTIRPGATAAFPIFGQDWNHALDRPCPNAQRIRVEPPGGGGWLSVRLQVPACPGWNVGPLLPGRRTPWPSFALSEFRRRS